MVASGVDFFVGISAAGEELLLGVALALAAGDEDLVGEGELFGFGVGEAVFSVVTETLGSEGFSAAGEALSSWATAIGTAAVDKAAIRAKSASFIWRIVGSGSRWRQGSKLPRKTLWRQSCSNT